jgi:hypothetical protein
VPTDDDRTLAPDKCPLPKVAFAPSGTHHEFVGVLKQVADGVETRFGIAIFVYAAAKRAIVCRQETPADL